MTASAYIYSIWKLLALIISAVLMLFGESPITGVILITLVLLCIFTLQFALEIVSEKRRPSLKSASSSGLQANTQFTLQQWICVVFDIVLLIALYFMNIPALSPVAIVIILQLSFTFFNGLIYYCISGICTFLYLLLSTDDLHIIVLSITIMTAVILQGHMMTKLRFLRESSLRQRNELLELDERLKDNQRLTKTIRYAAALEERNRMAARLHDKIGHNISGSILMLEASLLHMEKNPEKAVEEINRTVEHLRNGVDDLRHALREERPLYSDIGINDIQLLLEQTQAEHGLHTMLKTEGDIGRIPVELWQCVRENATELLTNVLKHSNATMFTLQIKVMSSMIHVVYSDNGNCKSDFKKGLGLEAVEERTVKCGGRCFFEGGELGFRVTNVFPLMNI